MSTPTSVSINIYVNEGLSDKQTQVFANGKAQVPVTVYVNVVGSGKVKEYGLLKRQTANDLSKHPNELGYSLPPNMTASPVESVNERQYQAYPDLRPQAPPTATYSAQQTFLVTCNDPNLVVPGSAQHELMGYVCIEGYENSIGKLDTIFLYTDMDAKDESGQPFFQQSYITVDTFAKPEIKTHQNYYEPKDLDAEEFEEINIYLFYFNYGDYEGQYTFSLRDYNIRVEETHPSQEQYISTDPSDRDIITEFSLRGETAGINTIARAFIHHESVGKITQELASGSYSYNYDKNYLQDGALASASCFYLHDASIMNDTADLDEFDLPMYIDVKDVYGGYIKVKYSADLNAHNDGHAKINQNSIEVINP